MWDLGYRCIAALASVLSGCVFLYNVWGPILVLTILLCLTVYACYSLIVNDSSLSPHASFLFDYCVHAALEVRTHFETIAEQIYRWSRTFWETTKLCFFEVCLTKIGMERRRGTHYQLSTDPYPTRRNSSKFDPIAQLSPIPRNVRESNMNEMVRSNSSYARNSLTKLASTPLVYSQNKEEYENQLSEEASSQRVSPVYSQYNNSAQGEEASYYHLEGSPWGTTISPKARATMEKSSRSPSTPLSSTRCNIDARVYRDVTSPGLATRLTKYATEVNNRLNRHSQYHMGQFPKINLQSNQIPLLNAKCVKTRTPVIVRVAPPDKVCYSPPGKHKILTNLCNMDDGLGSGNIPYGLKETSLKRHAEREDIAFDLAKKQRTGGISMNEIETQDETKQKRSRDESSKSEEEISPQNKSVRPAKRTKTPSCYDILNSFSSSKHVVSGIKRKARDLSRCGTPDFEKHFKSLESVANFGVQTLSEVQNTSVKYREHNESMEKLPPKDRNVLDRVEGKLSPLKGILKPSPKSLERDSRDKEKRYSEENRPAMTVQATGKLVESAKLANKLFMRAEPERNEKLRMLVEEQGNIRAKFTTDDVEEIKKEDIADMRQTSMKARLQSMFDAISGKATSKINPDVVIQAEEVNTVKSSPCPPASCITLNSSTTTTNANTTPISTSAIIPSPGTKSPKHVAFELPNKEVSSNLNASAGNVATKKIENTPVSNPTSAHAGSSGIAFTNSSGNAILPSPTVSLNSTTGHSEVRNFKPGVATTTNNFVSSTTTTPIVARVTPTANLIRGTTSVTFSSSSIPASTTSALAKDKTSNSQVSEKVLPVSNAVSVTKNNAALSMTLPSVWNAASTSGSNAIGNKEQNTAISSVSTTRISSIVPTTMTSTPLFSFGSKGSAAKTETGFAFGSSFGGNNSDSVSTSTNANASTFAAAVSSASTSTATSASAIVSVPNSVPILQNNLGIGGTTKSETATIASSTNQALSRSNVTTTVGGLTSGFDLSSNVKTAASPFQLTKLPNFSFGASSTDASGNSNKPGFSFGNVATTTAATNVSSGTSNTTLFSGVSNNSSKQAFGNSMNNSNVGSNNSQFNATAASIFGNTATTTVGSVFGTTPGQSIFGASTTKTTTVSVNTTSTNSTPEFLNKPATGTSLGMLHSNSASIFGSVAKTASPGGTGVTGASGNVFSNANPTSAFGTPSNIFGQTTSLTDNLKSTTGTFASTATPVFGSPSTTVATFSSTASVTSNATPSIFGSVIVSRSATEPSFAGTYAASPVFGSQNNVASKEQSTASHGFGSGTNIFGGDSTTTASATTPVSVSASSTSSATPAFGSAITMSTPAPAATSISAPSSIVISNVISTSSSNAFAGHNAGDTTFGAPANASGTTLGSNVVFNQNKAPTFGQASPFTTPNTYTTGFGSGSASNANNSAGVFTFGANSNQKSPQQPVGSFSFGSSGNNSNNNNNNNNATASSSSPFQFNASAPKQGFNFSAPSATPTINFGTTSAPTFNASMTGMFSIGSGSTAPRSRSVRTRKPR
ncbi:uncharacterized protein LOC144477122 isoform X2 [Augochlora pura]